jgi:hypothetical protein
MNRKAASPQATARLLTICLRQIDLLSRAKIQCAPPALISPDIVQSRNATLIGSMRSPDQNENLPIRYCFPWQAVHKGTALRSPGFMPTPPSVPVRTCAGSDGAPLPQATQGRRRIKVRCCSRRRKSGLGLGRATVREIRGAGMDVRNHQRVRVQEHRRGDWGMGKLEGKVALVTESGRNIGRATVRRLGGEGRISWSTRAIISRRLRPWRVKPGIWGSRRSLFSPMSKRL